jgi:hypothetical protein
LTGLACLTFALLLCGQNGAKMVKQGLGDYRTGIKKQTFILKRILQGIL